jgi:hypothetical protein
METVAPQELALYIGTGLKLKWLHLGGWCDVELEGVESNGAIIIHEGMSIPTRLNMIRPVVRPWHQLAAEIEENGEKFVAVNRLAKANVGHYASSWVRSVKNMKAEAMGLDRVLLLASWRFDVFHWLDRIREDGLPMAVDVPLD